MKLFVCYIPGLDQRRIDPEYTPFLAEVMRRLPWTRLSTLPSNELLSSMVTGQRPDQHGIWQTTLKHQAMLAAYRLGVSPRTVARLQGRCAR